MRQLRGLNPAQDDNFNLITQDQVMDWWNKFTGVFFAVMVALSGVGLLVGGIGVIGIMMISVTERTREIGLRKSLGARRRDLLWQFLVEAATLTLLGGAIGMAFGGLIVWAVASFSPPCRPPCPCGPSPSPSWLRSSPGSVSDSTRQRAAPGWTRSRRCVMSESPVTSCLLANT